MAQDTLSPVPSLDTGSPASSLIRVQISPPPPDLVDMPRHGHLHRPIMYISARTRIWYAQRVNAYLYPCNYTHSRKTDNYGDPNAPLPLGYFSLSSQQVTSSADCLGSSSFDPPVGSEPQEMGISVCSPRFHPNAHILSAWHLVGSPPHPGFTAMQCWQPVLFQARVQRAVFPKCLHRSGHGSPNAATSSRCM